MLRLLVVCYSLFLILLSAVCNCLLSIGIVECRLSLVVVVWVRRCLLLLWLSVAVAVTVACALAAVGAQIAVALLWFVVCRCCCI